MSLERHKNRLLSYIIVLLWRKTLINTNEQAGIRYERRTGTSASNFVSVAAQAGAGHTWFATHHLHAWFVTHQLQQKRNTRSNCVASFPHNCLLLPPLPSAAGKEAGSTGLGIKNKKEISFYYRKNKESKEIFTTLSNHQVCIALNLASRWRQVRPWIESRFDWWRNRLRKWNNWTHTGQDQWRRHFTSRQQPQAKQTQRVCLLRMVVTCSSASSHRCVPRYNQQKTWDQAWNRQQSLCEQSDWSHSVPTSRRDHWPERNALLHSLPKKVRTLDKSTKVASAQDKPQDVNCMNVESGRDEHWTGLGYGLWWIYIEMRYLCSEKTACLKFFWS